ncbi:DinB family protein [Pedobacter fastidiosus]|uniref:DinB family protein n=1 Tax=Pedobacter fastidiosus TaxID=2765361 RepID=A0ABR7KS61_9SPHI|nr:DinB family protein [Pedobacter fastidiosus]MBC6110602.1 DinB family protein [Pedobacter fastidiosus]
MNPSKVKTSLHQIVDAYKAKLSSYSDNIFQDIPPINGWSYSEVYSHIFDSSLLSLMALENSARDKGENQPTHFAVKLILFFGSLPPAKKYKVPKRLAERVKKISKTEAMDFILEFEEALDQVYPLVPGAKTNSKTKHPRLGYLNAKQWLRFTEIHLKHHLKQLVRIEKSFQQSV